MPTLARDGVQLFYTEAGAGEPPLVLVHGWCCDHTYLAPQAAHFAPRHRVVSVDLRGHGQSDAPDQAYTIAGFADDLAWLCGELGLSRPVVIGHSMGGVVALALAARRPDLPAAVALLDSPVLLPESGRRYIAPYLERMRGADAGAAAAEFVGNMFLPTDDPARKAAIVAGMTAAPRHVMLPAMEAMLAHDTAADAAACRVPVLAVTSAAPGSNFAEFRRLCPRLVTGQTVGAGHFHQLDVPDQINAMLSRFLAITDLGG